MPIYSDEERERHNTVTGMLQGESDRGAVLIGAAFLDDLLEELLAAVFIDPTLLGSPKERERFGSLFGHGGPAGGFSNRINLAYALGLVSKRDHDDLHRVRDIRNDFAHKLQYTSFEDQSVSARCSGFAILKDILDWAWLILRDLTRRGDSTSGPSRFCMVGLLSRQGRRSTGSSLPHGASNFWKGDPGFVVARWHKSILGLTPRNCS